MTGRTPLYALLIAAGTVTAVPAVCLAEGEHARRSAVELTVLQGDLRRLASDAFTLRHKKGLRDRILGALAGLELLLRYADQEAGRPPRPGRHRARVEALRRSFEAGSLSNTDPGLVELLGEYPLRMTGLAAAEPTAGALADARRLHEELCAGCHDMPDLDTERPAYNLFRESRRLTGKEFAARLLLGVRGDRVTGIDNPLSDSQIAALMAYYASGD